MIFSYGYPNTQGATLSATGIIDWGMVYGTGGAPVVPTFDVSIFNRKRQLALRRRRQRRR